MPAGGHITGAGAGARAGSLEAACLPWGASWSLMWTRETLLSEQAGVMARMMRINIAIHSAPRGHRLSIEQDLMSEQIGLALLLARL